MNTQRIVDLGSSAFAGLDRLTGHIDHHVRRQQILAANLANLDTPGYRARDTVFEERLTAHLERAGWKGQAVFEEQVITDDDEAPDQDGNTVSLERQLAKLNANALRFGALSEILNRRIGLLRYAATDGTR